MAGAGSSGLPSRVLRAAKLERAIQTSGIRPGSAHRCPYLPGREARNLTIRPVPLLPGVYQALMALNFRRAGAAFYRPECEGCRECRATRVAVGGYRPNRAQRRCRARNRDVEVRVEAPVPTLEKHELYRRYLEARHDGQMDGSYREYLGFLHSSPIYTLELQYRIGERLFAVGIADLEPQAMSAVYCYFDPDQSDRSPGTLNVLTMIDECRRRGIEFLYLGYSVEACSQMSYKLRFRPCQLLGPDGEWRERQG
jgi:arginyl-tRNA--protein-N-Asp/Glu arginylyltransferase